MKAFFQSLHEKALQITKAYLKAESDLIAVLQEIDDCRGYRDMSFKSLFEYVTQGLGMSESVSYNLITIARKAKEVPKLQEMIRKQEITVSNARTIAPVLSPENQGKWLPAAAVLSKRALEKEIAKEFPETQVQEQARYVSEKRIELKCGISEELHVRLKRTQDLVSSESRKAVSLEETLEALVTLYIEKKDPVEKARRAEKREADRVQDQQQDSIGEPSGPASPVPGQVNSNPRFVPARLEHAVRLRDDGQCTQKSVNGLRCSEKRWLDIHHIQPLSEGGQTSFNNLTLICRGHHQALHHVPRPT